MKRRLIVWVGGTLITLFLVACGADKTEQKLPPSASAAATDLYVAEQREIEIEDGRVHSLSPDGRWLLVETNRALCIYQTEPVQLKTCVDQPDNSVDWRNVAWSPDGSRVAFTQDFIRMFVDSDLWVLEAETGKLTNLTDDGVDRFRPGSQDSLQVDLCPTWSPDGKSLLFSRSSYSEGEWQGTALYRIPADGGDPQKLLSVSEEPAAVWFGLAWVGNARILYTVNSRETDDPANGIWAADQDGQNPQHLLGATDSDMGPPFLADVANGGDKALVWYYAASIRFAAAPNRSFFALLDLQTGEVTALKQAQGTELEFGGPADATLSPDGSKILYTYRDASGDFGLAVRQVEGGEENILLTAKEPLGVSRSRERGLDWANNDVIYVGTPSDTPWLLKVEGK